VTARRDRSHRRAINHRVSITERLELGAIDRTLIDATAQRRDRAERLGLQADLAAIDDGHP